MANLIHMYKGSVTSGGTDGTQVSEGDGSNPLTIGPLNATNNEESAAVKIALRCDSGYATSGNTIITPTGTSKNMWALASDNNGSAGAFGTYGTALTISDSISNTNKVFWVKAKSVDTENPSNDVSVNLVINTLIIAQ